VPNEMVGREGLNRRHQDFQTLPHPTRTHDLLDEPAVDRAVQRSCPVRPACSPAGSEAVGVIPTDLIAGACPRSAVAAPLVSHRFTCQSLVRPCVPVVGTTAC